MVIAVEIWEMAGYISKVEQTRFTGIFNMVCKRMKKFKGDFKKFGLKTRMPSSEMDEIARTHWKGGLALDM